MALHARDHGRRPDGPAAAPAGHRVGLRRRSAEHRAIAAVPRQHAGACCAGPGRRSACRSRDPARSRCPRRAASLAIASSSASEISAPVGLPGELMMMPRVRGVTAPRIASAVQREAVLGVVRTITGVASASLICSTSVGQPGMCVMTSSPGPNSASTVLNSACLPPAVTMTSAAVLDAVVDLVALDDRPLELLGAGVGRVLREVGVDGARAPRRRCASASESPARRPRSRRRRRPGPSSSWRRPPPSSSATRQYGRRVRRDPSHVQALRVSRAELLLAQAIARQWAARASSTEPPSATTSLTRRELT